MNIRREGHRAVVVFVVQREDCKQLAPTDEVDPQYGRLLRRAKALGVELLAYVARITFGEIKLSHKIPIILE